ncbi:MAG: helix-turn-helix transcriptional regulator [Patescibacteria group bacterium]
MSKSIYTKVHEDIVNKLKNAREKAGLSQLEAAKKVGKTQSYISKVESGQRQIDIVELKKFAQVYKKDLKEFIN